MRHASTPTTSRSQRTKIRFDLDQKQSYEIYEYACHEGNYGLANVLSAARAQERAKLEPQR